MTEQKLEELLPCPFHKLDTSVDLTDNDYGRWFVVCGGCGASSGHCKTKERAVYSWNNDRASTKKEAELMDLIETLIRQDTRSTKARTKAVKLLTNFTESKP